MWLGERGDKGMIIKARVCVFDCAKNNAYKSPPPPRTVSPLNLPFGLATFSGDPHISLSFADRQHIDSVYSS